MMKTEIIDRLEKVITQSKIILSAIQVGDMDIVQAAIDERGQLIQELERNKPIIIDQEITTLFREFQMIENNCKTEMELLKKRLESESFENKNQMHKAQRNKQAFDKYHINNNELYTGLSIDNKK